MIEITVDELNCQVSRVPEAEIWIDGEAGAHAFEITLTDQLTITLRQDDAEDLYNALAMHFAGL